MEKVEQKGSDIYSIINCLCIYHALRLGCEFRAREKTKGEKMISISSTLINLNSKQGLGGKLQQELMSGSRSSLCIVSMFIPKGPMLDLAGHLLLKRGCWGGGSTGVKCKESKVLILCILFTWL